MPNRASRPGPRAHLHVVAYMVEHAAPGLGQALPLELLELELQLQDADTIGARRRSNRRRNRRSPSGEHCLHSRRYQLGGRHGGDFRRRSAGSGSGRGGS